MGLYHGKALRSQARAIRRAQSNPSSAAYYDPDAGAQADRLEELADVADDDARDQDRDDGFDNDHSEVPV